MEEFAEERMWRISCGGENVIGCLDKRMVRRVCRGKDVEDFMLKKDVKRFPEKIMRIRVCRREGVEDFMRRKECDWGSIEENEKKSSQKRGSKEGDIEMRL